MDGLGTTIQNFLYSNWNCTRKGKEGHVARGRNEMKWKSVLFKTIYFLKKTKKLHPIHTNFLLEINKKIFRVFADSRFQCDTMNHFLLFFSPASLHFWFFMSAEYIKWHSHSFKFGFYLIVRYLFLAENFRMFGIII